MGGLAGAGRAGRGGGTGRARRRGRRAAVGLREGYLKSVLIHILTVIQAMSRNIELDHGNMAGAS